MSAPKTFWKTSINTPSEIHFACVKFGGALKFFTEVRMWQQQVRRWQQQLEFFVTAD